MRYGDRAKIEALQKENADLQKRYDDLRVNRASCCVDMEEENVKLRKENEELSVQLATRQKENSKLDKLCGQLVEGSTKLRANLAIAVKATDSIRVEAIKLRDALEKYCNCFLGNECSTCETKDNYDKYLKEQE